MTLGVAYVKEDKNCGVSQKAPYKEMSFYK